MSADILVCGDLMIDRSWLVSSRVAHTVQSHAEVSPLRRIYPDHSDARLGGAGQTAAAIVHYTECPTHLLAAFSPLDVPLLEFLHLRARPEQATDIALIPIFDGPAHSTIKFRIYRERSNKPPELCHRFDQDAAPLPDHANLSKACLEMRDPEYVVVSDFNKGTLRPQLVKQLAERFSRSRWLIDSKNPRLFTEVPALRNLGGTIFCNLDEVIRLGREVLGNDTPLPHTDVLPRDDSRLLDNAELLRLGNAIVHNLRGFHLVIKLSHTGAIVVVDQGSSTGILVARLHARKRSGVGAGDHFLGGWLSSLVRGGRMEEALHAATDHAVRWVEFSDDHFWKNKLYLEVQRDLPDIRDLTPERAKQLPATTAKAVVEPMAPFKKRLDDIQKQHRYPDFMVHGNRLRIRRSDGSLYLPGYVGIDPEFGAQVAELRRAIRTQFASLAPRRPLNCLLIASPGAGKSYFVKKLAEGAGAEFREINVARCPDQESILKAFMNLAIARIDKLVLLIDEFDTEVGGHHVFPLLLGPLWDGEFDYEGQRRTLGKNFVSVLVGSQRETTADFVTFLHGAGSKGPDLVSRINGPRLQLSKPRPDVARVEKVYLVCDLLQRYLRLIKIDKRCIDALLELDEQGYTTRDLEYLVLMIPDPGDGELTFADLLGPLRTYLHTNPRGRQERIATKLKELGAADLSPEDRVVWLEDD